MKQTESEDHFAPHIPALLQYHQKMLGDEVRNRQLYKAIKRVIKPGMSFLDVGAGTGVWAILAAKLGAKRVVAIEVEEPLIPVIYKLASENGVADRIEIVHSRSDDAKIKGKFDVIVSELFSSDALGEQTIASFLDIRKRFLAPGGVLIPQKLAMYAAPAKLDTILDNIPRGIDLECGFFKELKINYPQALAFSDHKKLKLLADPELLIEIDFATVTREQAMKSVTASWHLRDISRPNCIVTYNRSTFAKGIAMDSFDSPSWLAVAYPFAPFPKGKGELRFDLNTTGENATWSVSSTGSTPATKNYSPVFAYTRLRMAQQMTPHERYEPPKD